MSTRPSTTSRTSRRCTALHGSRAWRRRSSFSHGRCATVSRPRPLHVVIGTPWKTAGRVSAVRLWSGSQYIGNIGAGPRRKTARQRRRRTGGAGYVQQDGREIGRDASAPGVSLAHLNQHTSLGVLHELLQKLISWSSWGPRTTVTSAWSRQCAARSGWHWTR